MLIGDAEVFDSTPRKDAGNYRCDAVTIQLVVAVGDESDQDP
jgi:hypothetical protein